MPALGLKKNVERDVLMATNRPRSTVSSFVRSLFDSCRSSTSDENALSGKLATFLGTVGEQYLRDARPTNAMAYLLLSNLKYGIPSVVSVTMRERGAILISHNKRHDLTLLSTNFH